MPKGPLIGEGRTAEVYAWGDHQILKLYRAGMPNDWVEYEAKVGRMVCEAGLAAPAIGGIIQDGDRLGIIYERIDGPTLLQSVAARPWTLFSTARRFAELHAAMHACVKPELPAQRAALQRAIHSAPRLSADLQERILQKLAALPDGEAVCHGDYHPDNILMSARGLIVIDWMSATHGNPVADVARTTLLFRIATLPASIPAVQRRLFELVRRLFYAAYLRRYRQLRPVTHEQIEAWQPVLAAAHGFLIKN